TMSSKVILLLLLGLSLRGGDASSSKPENRKYIARLNNSEATHDLPADECSEPPTTISSLNLHSIIRAVVNGDWDQVPFVLQMANEACTLEMSHGILNTLWLEWQRDQQIDDPLKTLGLFEQLELQSNVSTALLQNVYQAFVSRSAQLISAPFRTNSSNAEFPQVASLLLSLRQTPQKYMRDILETLFDAVLSLESALSVAQRLGNFNASLTQLIMTNLQMLNRTEVEFNSKAHTTLLGNLRKLMYYPKFKLEGDPSLVAEVLKLLPSQIGLLFIYDKVCLRKANNKHDYLYRGKFGLNIWTQKHHYKEARFIVESVLREANNEIEFAFRDPYYLYLVMDLTIETEQQVRRNMFSGVLVNWWHVVEVQGGVAIYDAATSGRMICGGNRTYWKHSDPYAYTRPSEDFDFYRDECTWSIEDCSNK
ncbi:hypothetical protein KR044_001999, partial [Drosophila immigrans]